jgi:hypothetical protein
VDAETHFDPLVPLSYLPASSIGAAQYPSCSDSVEQKRNAVLQEQQRILAQIEEDREERRKKRHSVSSACPSITESQALQQQVQELVVISSSSTENSPLSTAQKHPQHDNPRRSSRLSSLLTGSISISSRLPEASVSSIAGAAAAAVPGE